MRFLFILCLPQSKAKDQKSIVLAIPKRKLWASLVHHALHCQVYYVMLCYSERTRISRRYPIRESRKYALLRFHFTPKCWYKSCFEVLKATFNHFSTWWTVKIHTEPISIDISTVKVRRAIPSCLSLSWSYLGTLHMHLELWKGLFFQLMK